jgi:hypothetical protein
MIMQSPLIMQSVSITHSGLAMLSGPITYVRPSTEDAGQ